MPETGQLVSTSMIVRASVGFLFCLLVSALGTPSSSLATDCSFVLGFKTFHELVPDVVGECVVDQRYNPQNGDSLQETTRGLLAWRKSDNFTAFTDGHRTWVNGPVGLQERLNFQRFFWEARSVWWSVEEIPVVPPPSNGDRCHTAYLELTPGQANAQGNAGAGHQGLIWTFTNNTSVSCTFFGYVGVQMLDELNIPLPTNVVTGGYLGDIDPGPSPVVVPPWGHATFEMAWGVVPTDNETACPQASRLLVTPPDEFGPLTVSTRMAPCNGGTIDVTAIEAGS